MADMPLHLKIVKGHEKKAVCPLCQQPAEAPYTPFCSHRCGQIDLGKWLTEGYTIPAHEVLKDSDVETLLAAHEGKQEMLVDDDG
tara:strand:- start:1037 stop:1291 length:255 start_codon:yes stop_codon:yes gene_type:complete